MHFLLAVVSVLLNYTSTLNSAEYVQAVCIADAQYDTFCRKATFIIAQSSRPTPDRGAAVGQVTSVIYHDSRFPMPTSFTERTIYTNRYAYGDTLYFWVHHNRNGSYDPIIDNAKVCMYTYDARHLFYATSLLDRISSIPESQQMQNLQLGRYVMKYYSLPMSQKAGYLFAGLASPTDSIRLWSFHALCRSWNAIASSLV